MPEILKDLKPYEVFKYFEELSRIPRGSGNEREVSNYLVNFAKRHQLDFVQDKDLNIVIKKPATPGYESSPTLIIQGHMDMVCEKNSDSDHDFTRDPLNLRIVDDMIYATGTTLGADNGIAVAFGLAILASSEYPHPSLEFLVTTSEETGMDGAMALDPSSINGRILINIDSEEEGKILAGCAGGGNGKNDVPVGVGISRCRNGCSLFVENPWINGRSFRHRDRKRAGQRKQAARTSSGFVVVDGGYTVKYA